MTISPGSRLGPYEILSPLGARGVRSRLTFEPWFQENPVWSPDSRRLAYDSNREGLGNRGPDRKRKFVEVKPGEGFQAGAPKDLFETPENWGHDITPDGQRFLFNLPVNDAPASPITVVLNWAEGVKELKK